MDHRKMMFSPVKVVNDAFLKSLHESNFILFVYIRVICAL